MPTNLQKRPCRVGGDQLPLFPGGFRPAFPTPGCKGRGSWVGLVALFFRRCVSLCRENYSFPVPCAVDLWAKMDEQDRNSSMNSEWGIKSVCPVCYTSVKPSRLKDNTLHFFPLSFPGYRYFCDFYFVWGFDYLIFFKVSCQYMNSFSKRESPHCSAPTLQRSQVHFLEMWTGVSSGKRSYLCYLGLFCPGKNHAIHSSDV